MMMYQTFPKVELHLHLDGSMRIQTACELLQLKEEIVKKKMEAPISCDSLTDYLQEIFEKCEFKKWYFGHYHDNRTIDSKYVLLYDEIVPLKYESVLLDKKFSRREVT